MSTKLLFLLFLLGIGSLPTGFPSLATSHPTWPNYINDEGEVVGFCSLVKKPAQYRGHTMQLSAVLVENNRTRIDGADPFLYDPSCRNKRIKVVVRWSNSSHDDSTASDKLRAIRESSDEFGVSRTTVLLVGRLSDKGHRFGHLGWADLEFNIDDVRKAEPVAPNLPWPKWVEEAYRKARTKL